MKTRSLRRKRLFGNLLTYCIVAAAFVILQLLNAGGMLSPLPSGAVGPHLCLCHHGCGTEPGGGHLRRAEPGPRRLYERGCLLRRGGLHLPPGTDPHGPLRLLVSMLIGAFFAGIAGVIVGVPVLRLRGDYLAIVTLAFGEIIKNIINILYVGVDENGLHFSTSSEAALNLAETGKAILKGPMGVTANVKLSSFTAGFLLVMVALIVVLNLVNSRSGRAIMALRDNRIAAESVGISATKYKLMAFVTSAVLAGAAGALYAMNYSSIAAKKFDFNTSILILVYVVLGGLGNIWGSVIAAALLYVLPELLRDFYDYRMLIYAIVLILVMLATNNERSKEFFSSLRRKILGRGTEKGGAQNG